MECRPKVDVAPPLPPPAPVRARLWGVAGLTVVAVTAAGIAVQRLEPGRFDTVLEGIWWAASTVTTVGYGDFVPVSGAGRAVGFALMFTGAALFAAAAAVIAAVIVVGEVEQEEREIESKEDEILALLASLDARVGRLEQGTSFQLPRAPTAE